VIDEHTNNGGIFVALIIPSILIGSYPPIDSDIIINVKITSYFVGSFIISILSLYVSVEMF
jgi:hypothetical protein